MGFAYDAQGTKPMTGGRKIAPPGEYILKIVDAEDKVSNAGKDMVKVVFQIAAGEYEGVKVYHYVVFHNPKENKVAAGITLDFLKRIDQPYEGKFEVNPSKWLGKEVCAHLIEETYGQYVNNKIHYFLDQKDSEATPF